MGVKKEYHLLIFDEERRVSNLSGWRLLREKSILVSYYFEAFFLFCIYVFSLTFVRIFTDRRGKERQLIIKMNGRSQLSQYISLFLQDNKLSHFGEMQD